MNIELTPREVEVLKLIHAGMSTKEIANYLDISENTIRVHRSKIFSKLCFTNLVQAAVWYERNREWLNASE
jgi:DNA-binding NarL/FixJ family response regulator